MSLHYDVAGDSPLTVVFTHGLGASGATWRAQVEYFSAHFRVVTWDLRGHGQSSSPAGPLQLSGLAGDLRVIMEQVGTTRAVAVGHSAGGVIAMQFALEYPERLAGLVLVGTASECNTGARRFYHELAAIAEQEGFEPIRKRLGIGTEQANLAPVDPIGLAKIARVMAGLHEEPLTPRLSRIRCPTLVVVGSKDPLGVGGSVIASRNIAGSRLEIVADRGHGLFLEDPVGFNRLVGKFLQNIARG